MDGFMHEDYDTSVVASDPQGVWGHNINIGDGVQIIPKCLLTPM